MDGEGIDGRKPLKASEDGNGHLPLSEWPTVAECRDFNRRAEAWLRARGQQSGFDGFEYGKHTDGADTD